MHRSKCLSRLLYSPRGILPTWRRTPMYGCKHTRVLVYHPACRTPSRARPAHYYAHSKTRREILALFVDHQNLSGYSCLLHCLKNRCLLSNEIQQRNIIHEVQQHIYLPSEGFSSGEGCKSDCRCFGLRTQTVIILLLISYASLSDEMVAFIRSTRSCQH